MKTPSTANPPKASPLNANAINSPNANNNTSATTNPTNVNTSNVNAATASGSPTPANSTSTATGSGDLPEGRLEFEFAGQAWVEVRDKHGDVLFSRTMPAKSKHILRGEPPFMLRVGNASAVSVVLDGRPVDLMPYTRNEIAKLVIPAQNP